MYVILSTFLYGLFVSVSASFSHNNVWSIKLTSIQSCILLVSNKCFVSTGETVNTQATGVRIMFPKIADIEGMIRQRYPVMPIYGEGNLIWKRLNAFEDSLDGYETKVTNDDMYFQMGVSHAESTGDSEKDITEHTNRKPDSKWVYF